MIKYIKSHSSALKYLHSQRIIHCDLKLNNIVVTNSDNAKICDFGLAITTHEVKHGLLTRGNSAYMPPEILGAAPQISNKVDIFSFGIIAWELRTQTVAWELSAFGEKLPDYLFFFLFTLGFRPSIEKLSPQPLGELLQRCWVYEPKDRPDADEIQQRLSQINFQ